MYFLKTKGTGKIPDYVQVRDNNLVLIKHFKAGNSAESAAKLGIIGNADKFVEFINNLEYGELKKYEI